MGLRHRRRDRRLLVEVVRQRGAHATRIRSRAQGFEGLARNSLGEGVARFVGPLVIEEPAEAVPTHCSAERLLATVSACAGAQRFRAAFRARSIFAHVSRSVTVRLNTGAPGALSGSTQK